VGVGYRESFRFCFSDLHKQQHAERPPPLVPPHKGEGDSILITGERPLSQNMIRKHGLHLCNKTILKPLIWRILSGPNTHERPPRGKRRAPFARRCGATPCGRTPLGEASGSLLRRQQAQSSPASSFSGPWLSAAARMPALERIVASMALAMSGFWRKKVLAFSRPWPMRSPL
jgi:hypothetical protein